MCLLEYGRKAGASDYADFDDDEDGAEGSGIPYFQSSPLPPLRSLALLQYLSRNVYADTRGIALSRAIPHPITPSPAFADAICGPRCRHAC